MMSSFQVSQTKCMSCLSCVLHASSSHAQIFSSAFKSESGMFMENEIKDASKGEVCERHFDTTLM